MNKIKSNGVRQIHIGSINICEEITSDMTKELVNEIDYDEQHEDLILRYQSLFNENLFVAFKKKEFLFKILHQYGIIIKGRTCI